MNKWILTLKNSHLDLPWISFCNIPPLCIWFYYCFWMGDSTFSNPTYLIFKDTLFWGIFGLIILIYYMNNILILKKLFINIFDITEKGWRVVSIRWIVFAFMLSISNQIALIYFTPDQWVIYKMCTLVALVLFSMLQFSSSRKHRNPTANPWGMKV